MCMCVYRYIELVLRRFIGNAKSFYRPPIQYVLVYRYSSSSNPHFKLTYVRAMWKFIQQRANSNTNVDYHANNKICK